MRVRCLGTVSRWLKNSSSSSCAVDVHQARNEGCRRCKSGLEGMTSSLEGMTSIQGMTSVPGITSKPKSPLEAITSPGGEPSARPMAALPSGFARGAQKPCTRNSKLKLKLRQKLHVLAFSSPFCHSGIARRQWSTADLLALTWSRAVLS